MKNSKGKPSTVINKNAQNTNGQRHSMKGAVCKPCDPPNQHMHTSKNYAIKPTSNLGSNRFDKN